MMRQRGAANISFDSIEFTDAQLDGRRTEIDSFIELAPDGGERVQTLVLAPRSVLAFPDEEDRVRQ